MTNQTEATHTGRQFSVLLIAQQPYKLLDTLSSVPVIQTSVCRDLAKAKREFQSQQFDAVLVQLEESWWDGLASLRKTAEGAPLIGMLDSADESRALKRLDGILDDYLLTNHLPANVELQAEQIVRACRQARRLRAAHTACQSKTRIAEQLRRQTQELNFGLDTLRCMLDAKTANNGPNIASPTLELQDELLLIDSLRQANAPIRRSTLVTDLIASALHLAQERGMQSTTKISADITRPIYCDARQVAGCLAEFMIRADQAGASEIAIRATQRKLAAPIEILMEDNGEPLSQPLLSSQLARFPQRGHWETDPTQARSQLKLGLARRILQHNLGRVQMSANGAGSQVVFHLPEFSAQAVFAGMFDRLQAASGPDVEITLLQIRTPLESPNAAVRLQSLIRPYETAFPTSNANWLVAITAEAQQIDARMQSIWRDWSQAGLQPLIMRAIGRWPLAEKREELLAHVQTLEDLGDLSIETHPNLLLVRPNSKSGPTALDRRLQAAGFNVVLSEEEGLSDVMHACCPDAVIVACENGEQTLNSNIAQTMDCVAQIPVILMSATARQLQQSLQRTAQDIDASQVDTRHLDTQQVDAKQVTRNLDTQHVDAQENGNLHNINPQPADTLTIRESAKYSMPASPSPAPSPSADSFPSS